jgi:hypothetical protein
MYRFDPISGQIVWVKTFDQVEQTGLVSFGEGDLSIDAGSRENEISIIDQGERV